MLSSWLRRWARQNLPASRRVKRRPRLEVLEDRTLLSWTPVGPAPINNGQTPGSQPVSGRVTVVVPDPTDATILYLGTAGGGVWKSTNFGTTWAPLTDAQTTLAVGALAIAPSDHTTLYAGTGDANFLADSTYGRGVLKSTDSGATWTLVGQVPFNRRTISKVVIDPTNKDVVYVAVAGGGANGVAGGTGVWKTTDGGTNWTNTTLPAGLSGTDAYTDLVLDPGAPGTLYAAVGTINGAAANGVYKTIDGGASWSAVGATFPTGTTNGRTVLTIFPSNPQILYASVAGSGQGGTTLGNLYKFLKSTDGGSSWIEPMQSGPIPVTDYLQGEGQFNTALAVDPTDSNVIYAAGNVGNNSVLRITLSASTGTATVADISKEAGANGTGPHGGHHGLVFDRNNKLLDGNDGGVWRLDAASPVDWTDLNNNLQITLSDSVAIDPSPSPTLYGGSLDNGTNKYAGTGTAWTHLRDSDGGVVRADFGAGFNPASAVFHEFPFGTGFLEVSLNGGGTWADATNGIDTTNASNPFPPLVIDPSDQRRLLLGTDRVYERINNPTNNRNGTWNAISRPGLNGWNIGDPIDSIGVPRTDPNTLYAGAGGRVLVGTNLGGTWTWVEGGPVMPFDPNVKFTDLLVDPANANIAYVVAANFGGQTGGGHVWRTVNRGATWANITGNLPDLPTWCIELDPRTPAATDDLLYVGTDRGVFVSADLGTTWAVADIGLPNVQVLDLELNRQLGILAAATHGRGVWEIINGSIRGTKFQDTNGNGVKDLNEPGLQDWVIYLDANNNGTPDADEFTSTTDPFGNYTFTNLPVGTYRVREVLQAGWTQTLAPPATTVLGSGQNVINLNIGNFQNMSVSGQVFNDQDGNGVKDPGDPGLLNWVLFQDLNSNGTLDSGEPTATSDAAGDYAFTNLGPATYRVREVLQNGWSPTLIPFGDILPQSGQVVTGVDHGNFQLITISGTKFNDQNGNGVRDGGDPGLQNWRIYLDLNNDGVFQIGVEPSALTDGAGGYTIPDLGPDLNNLGPLTFRVREVLQAGWVQTAPAVPVNVVAQSGTNRTVNFGNFQLVSISGTKFNDFNGNRARDTGEPALMNWVIFLDANDNGALDTGEPRATTDASGNYTLANVGPGTFRVREVLQTGWVQTTPVPNVSLTSGTDVTGQDIGNFRVVSISGLKFNDQNGNAAFDSGEPGLPGWVIQLDLGADGTPDVTATTDAAGAYTFPGVGPGTYRVREVAQTGWTQTTANPADFVTASGANLSNVNFGNFRLASIRGQKFNDLDGDGVKGAGEPGLQGWVIQLDKDADGTPDATATTDTSGNYSFAGLVPGTYRVREAQQTGWVQTTTNPPDVVAQSGTSTTADFGNFRLITIGGQKFDDTNGDGIKGVTEPRLSGWVIQLDRGADGGVDATATTDASGNYSFPNLGPGTYRVREVGQTGWVQSTPVPADFTAQSGGDVALDFGNFRVVTLSGQKFNDADDDGVRDAGEGGLFGWVIQLDRGADGNVDATATTDGSGNYGFPNLGPGTYRVREVGQTGWKQTTANPPDVAAQSGVNVTGLDFGNFKLIALRGQKFNDADGNGAKDAGDLGLQGWVMFVDANDSGTLDPGENSATTDASGNYTLFVEPGVHKVREAQQTGWVRTTANPPDITINLGSPDVSGLDFGNFRLVTLRGQKFDDRDGNGAKNAGEPGLQGWVIQLDKDANGTVDATATTDASGNYSFPNLGPGTYRVREVGQAGWVQTTTDPADVPARSGTDVPGLDFGNFRLTTISGQKYEDFDGNGVRGVGETGLQGWMIQLDRGADGTVDATATTDTSGNYSFVNLGPDTYRLREVTQAGWVQTTINPADVAARSGLNVTGQDFGNFRTVTLSGRKFHDLDGDGFGDPNEPGLPGWVILLDVGADDTTDATATTDANGDYSFANLGPGTYRLREMPQAGWVQSSPLPNDFVPPSGGDMAGVDFGNFRTVTVSGLVYDDRNGNGVKDALDFALPGWVIQLDRGANGTVDATATTDASGSYSFSNLGPGTYRLREVGMAGWVQTSTNPDDVNSTSGTDVSGVNFGNFRTVTISGQTFDDTNGNGARNGGEGGAGGFVLFLDANGNGMLDGGEPTATSDASGAYRFSNLGPGTYRGREQARAGWVQTTANPPDLVPQSGGDAGGVDVGNFRLITISGRRFNDTNGNGMRDGGEPGVPGGTLFLDANGNGTRDPGEATATTDANGDYAFANLGPGTYRVRMVPQAGFTQTTPNKPDIIARSGVDVPGVDFGLFLPGTIRGVLFEDIDGNGVRDPGDLGLQGRVVRLDRGADGTADATTTTGADGSYQFTDLVAGTYRVREELPGGWIQTLPDPPDVVAASGSTTSGVDFGNFRTVSIVGRVFEDANGNGIADPGEPGTTGLLVEGILAGRQVTLTRNNTFYSTTTTDGNDLYFFFGLGPGTYRVRLTGVNDAVQTTPDPTDFVIRSGGGVQGLDFGLFFSFTIRGRVFTDLDGDGRDTGEPGVSGLTVEVLRDVNGNGVGDARVDVTVATTVTDGSGAYAVGGLGAGQYLVRTARLPGRRASLPADGAYVVAATSNGTAAGRDFGLLATLNQSYVFQLYVDLLGRTPDPAGLRSWTDGLDHGLSRAAVARGIEGSQEYKTNVVNHLFLALLGRQADPGGLVAGLSILNGTTLFVGAGDRVEQVKLMIYSSPEYFFRHGGTNAGFLDALYHDALGRGVDPGGAAGFGLALAAGASRASVARAVLDSPEGTQFLVEGFYQRYLRRHSDPAGLAGFVLALQAGLPEEDIIAAMVSSPEYVGQL